MIISHQHKFIFIKTLKTAGTSLEIALSEFCGPDDIITPITEMDEAYRKELGFRGKQNYFVPFSKYSFNDKLKAMYHRRRLRYYNHMAASEVMQYFDPEIWKNYYKFCFERNPFDKYVSWYFWLRGESKFKSRNEFIQSGSASRLSSFDLYTVNAIPVVDHVYRYEYMEQALDDITRVLNLPKQLTLPSKKAKSGLRKPNTPYQEFLTDYEKEWISKIFAREMKYFDYQF
ncbi:MAG: sulfotransferase family 2 domain-containing protein [Flavobacteriales bacterium]|nr:sulfotransferase family 2 domain-containing protein [Flavobacteriales bacterium]MCB9205478.1 sulfotransferase family 2 domain-containing protein [Flavobacteriales bacterium]